MDITSNKKEMVIKWEMVKLGDVLDYEQPTKYIVSSDLYDDKFDTPVLTAGKTFILGYTNETDGIYSNLPVIIFDDFTTVSKFVDFQFKVKSSAMKILKAKEDVADIRYLFYLLQTLNLDCEQHKRYWISKFAPLQIPLPALPVQKRIAAILDAADALRRKDQELLKKYDELAQAIFIDMFGDPVRNEKGWEVKKLESLCINSKGNIRTGPFGSQLLIEELKDNGIPVYGIDNVQSIGFIWAKSKHITEEKFKELNNFKIRKGDVLITRTGTVGRSCVAPDEIPESIIGPNLLKVSLNHELLLPDILSFMLNNFQSLKDKIKSMSPGATVAVFNSGNLKDLEICFLPIALQNKYSNILKSINIQKKIIAEKKQSDSLFQTLLQKAFKGEL